MHACVRKYYGKKKNWNFYEFWYLVPYELKKNAICRSLYITFSVNTNDAQYLELPTKQIKQCYNFSKTGNVLC
jgi:hypothetical protein